MYKYSLMKSRISFFGLLIFCDIKCLNFPISRARSNDNGSISENHDGTVGGLSAEDETCAVWPLEYLKVYVLPPRTKTSPGFNLSRNASSIVPITWFAIFTFIIDSSGIVPELVM